MSKIIEISDLEFFFNLLIKKLKADNIESIEINMDIYRFIPVEKWGSFEEDIIETGSLFDDIDSLKLLLSDSKRPFSYVDFDRLASLLHLISEIRNPVNNG